MIRTNLSTRPFYNERARPPLAARARAWWCSPRRSSTSRACSATRAATRSWRRRPRSDEARAAELREEAARLRASVDPRQVDFAVRRRAAGQRSDRSPHLLVDRALQPLRDDAARRRAHHLGAAARRPRARHRRSPSTSSAKTRGRRRTTFMENLEKTGAFTDIRPARGAHRRSRACSISTLETVYLPRGGEAGRSAAEGGADDRSGSGSSSRSAR